MKPLQGQSVFDLAVQYCGSAEAVFELALLNGISITDELTPGVEMTASPILNKLVANYIKQNGILPATAIVPKPPKPVGIGYWGIEVDFVISTDLIHIPCIILER